MRLYRVRVYDDGGEVLRGRKWTAALDLTSGSGVREAAAQLTELTLTLARVDGARDDRVGLYYLAVHDMETDEFLFDWPGKGLPY